MGQGEARCKWEGTEALLVNHKEVDPPINGTAKDVDGTDSATMRENTLKDSKMVIPET